MKKNILKNEAKRILKKYDLKILESTILDILSSNIGYHHYKHYKESLDSNKFYNKIESKISRKTVLDLDEIENNILMDFKKCNEHDIKEIEFIRKEKSIKIERIKSVQALSLSKLFTLIPYMYKDSNKIINSDWSINEFATKSFIYWYADNMKSLYDEYGNKNYLASYEKYLSDKQQNTDKNYPIDRPKKSGTILDRGIAIVQKNYHGECFGEGFLFDLVYKLAIKEINIDELIDKLKSRIEKEKQNIISFNLSDDSSKYDVTLDSLFLNSIDDTKEKLRNIILNKDKYKIMLGYEMHYSLFGYHKEKKEVYLDMSELKSNIIISGSCGSGKTEFINSILFQDILFGKGVIYFETKGDNNQLYKINTLVQIADRGEDLVILNYNTSTDYFSDKLKLERALMNNKIIIVNYPSLEKAHIEINDKFADIIDNISISINDTINKNSYNRMNISIYTSEIEVLNKRALSKLNEIMISTKDENVKFILSSHSFEFREKELSYDLIKNNVGVSILMKMEDTHILTDYFQLNGIDARDFKSLNPGEFFIAKDSNFIKKAIYKANYLDITSTQIEFIIDIPH
jgi:hypothetical protein